jgi:hypothetical protein
MPKTALHPGKETAEKVGADSPAQTAFWPFDYFPVERRLSISRQAVDFPLCQTFGMPNAGPPLFFLAS